MMYSKFVLRSGKGGTLTTLTLQLKTDLGTPVWSYIPNVTEDATVVGSPSYIAETFSC